MKRASVENLGADALRVLHDALALALDPHIEKPYYSTVGEWTSYHRNVAEDLFRRITAERLKRLVPGGPTIFDG